MNESDLKMHPARSKSASLHLLTTIKTLMSIGYYRIPQGLVPRNIEENFLSCFCSFSDHASSRTLSCSDSEVLQSHGQIYGYPEGNHNHKNLLHRHCNNSPRDKVNRAARLHLQLRRAMPADPDASVGAGAQLSCPPALTPTATNPTTGLLAQIFKYERISPSHRVLIVSL